MATIFNQPANIETRIVYYRFDLVNTDDAAAYSAMVETLKGRNAFVTLPFNTGPESKGRKAHEHFHARIKDMARDGVAVLECAHVFDDQWNTPAEEGHNGLRLMEWQEWHYPRKSLREGYYLEINDAMRAVKRNAKKCGYCGTIDHGDDAPQFCPCCMGSEYLAEDQLPLLRLWPVAGAGKRPKALTEAEAAALLPAYRHAQIHGHTTRDAARIAKQRAALVKGCDDACRHAVAERDGMLWLMDNGIRTDNAIYYKHKEVFSFGWRSPLSEACKADLAAKLESFPFAWEFSNK